MKTQIAFIALALSIVSLTACQKVWHDSEKWELIFEHDKLKQYIDRSTIEKHEGIINGKMGVYTSAWTLANFNETQEQNGKKFISHQALVYASCGDNLISNKTNAIFSKKNGDGVVVDSMVIRHGSEHYELFRPKSVGEYTYNAICGLEK